MNSSLEEENIGEITRGSVHCSQKLTEQQNFVNEDALNKIAEYLTG